MTRGTLVVMAMAAAQIAGSATAGPIASFRDGEIIVTLPPDWQRVDQEELDAVSLWAAEATGGRIGEMWEAGFAPAGRDLQLGPPFVLLQIDETGRISYGEIAHPPEVDALQARIDGARAAGDELRTLTVQTVRFDRNRFALETTSVLASSPWGELGVRTLTYLTERGTVTGHGYLSSGADASEVRAVSSILETVRIADRLAYRPRLRDRWLDASRRPGFWYLLAAGMTLVTILVVWRSGRGRKG